MKAFAVAICLILGTACGACGASLLGCVHIERGCSWLEGDFGGVQFVSLQGQLRLPSCQVGMRLQVNGHYVDKPAHLPNVCSIADFAKHFEVASLSCEMGPGKCQSRVTLERWIIDNHAYLNNCLNDQDSGQRRKDDYYGAWCDGKPASVLDDKLQDLLLRDETPLVRRFDDDIHDHHIVCVSNGNEPHCNFTSNMLHF
jgi:hypothetical protein